MHLSNVTWMIVGACVVAAISMRWDHIPDTPHMGRLFVMRVLALCWVLLAIAVLFKTRTVLVPKPVGDPFATLSLVPFATIHAAIATQRWIQIVGNIIIFVPFPLLLRASIPPLTRRAQWQIALGVTASIEPMQLLINVLVQRPFNVVDIDDVLLNLMGCLIGIGLSSSVHRT